jgi:histone H3/H4
MIQVFLNYSMFLRKLAQEASLLALARGSKAVEAADISAAASEVLKQFRI